MVIRENYNFLYGTVTVRVTRFLAKFEDICNKVSSLSYPNDILNSKGELMENIIHCADCRHCFESRRSKTGYKCEVWGHDDFADDTILDGFCHKAKPRYKSDKNLRGDEHGRK